nr:DUF2460 domain-containing protein [Rickettsia endosymbiont of Ceutorhynchus assimilis]
MNSFAEMQFPPEISYGSKGGPQFSTDIVTTFSGHEQGSINWQEARSRYDISSGIKTEYQSINNGYDYKAISAINAQATTGFTLNKIPPASPLLFDESTEIIIQLLYGKLQSVNELALLSGANKALIGDELIQFQNAELIGDKKYKLTSLLRGRQGTEWAIASHKIGDKLG